MTDTVHPRVLIVTDKSDLAEAHWIIGLHRAGLPVHVACNPDGPNFSLLQDNALAVTPLTLTGRFDRGGTSVLRKLLQSNQIDIVHCFNPRALSCALRAGKRQSLRYVAYRGVIGNAGLLKPESWFTFLHPRLDRIVCVSEAVKSYFRGLGVPGVRIPDRKLVRIYKGHDLKWYTRPAADLSGFEFPEDAYVICCTGRDRPGKGFNTLIDSLAYLPDDSRVHLLLVGDLQGNDALLGRIRNLRRPERVRLAGFRTDAPQVAAACDAMVLPSESEGLPRVIIEAMAYGKPVVVTEAGGMPELVRNGVEGYVVPVRDPEALATAMTKMAENHDEAQAMGRRGRDRIGRDFRLDRTVEETVQLYRDLLS